MISREEFKDVLTEVVEAGADRAQLADTLGTSTDILERWLLGQHIPMYAARTAIMQRLAVFKQQMDRSST